MIIEPKTATLAEMNFDWRISSAQMTSNGTSFSVLPGYNRILLVLEGNSARLEAPGRNSTILVPMQTVHHFSGSDQTECFLEEKEDNSLFVRDFNVIFKENLKAKCEFLKNPSSVDPKYAKIVLIHNLGPKVSILVGKQEFCVEKDDTLWIENDDSTVVEEIKVNGESNEVSALLVGIDK